MQKVLYFPTTYLCLLTMYCIELKEALLMEYTLTKCFVFEVLYFIPHGREVHGFLDEIQVVWNFVRIHGFPIQQANIKRLKALLRRLKKGYLLSPDDFREVF